MWDLLTEAQAFAWIWHTHGLCPRFTEGDGLPDLEWGDGNWLEAKAIHRSKEEEKFLEHVSTANAGIVIRWSNLGPASEKFRSKLDKTYLEATSQLARVAPRTATVWINVRMDFGVSPRLAKDALCRWVDRHAGPGKPRVVVIWASEWKVPLADSGAP
jgi:hypothetical protein